MEGEGTQPRRKLMPDELAQLGRAAAQLGAAESRVLAVYLHGSAARGEDAADIDIAVMCEPELGFAELDRLAVSLRAKTGVRDLEVDLRSLASATPRFRANVLRDGKLLFERDPRRRQQVEARFMIEWTDFLPTWQRMRERMLERWAHG